MAYFLKKSKTSNDIYLQIYESFYDPIRKGSAHKSIKPIGYVKKLKALGIDDPISFYQSEVDRMNKEYKANKNNNKQKEISDSTPERLLGYFPIKNINDQLSVKKYLDLLQTHHNFKFNIYDLLSSLIYARIEKPVSKYKTFEEVLPLLFEDNKFSVDQLYDGLAYLGRDYERIIEIYNHQVELLYGINTTNTYFDSTNYYFEIDKEDSFRCKGPSKENRNSPIVSMGLLLDNNLIPIGMRIFPGNKSEKPIIREVINDLKKRNNIKGRTIQVADKGLNCSNNIIAALKQKDGYLFSKSIKTLPEKELTWVYLPNDYKQVKDSQGNLLYMYKSCIDEYDYAYTDETNKKIKIKIQEKRLVTYNPSLAKKQKMEINKQIQRAKYLCLSKAKKEEYGDCGKYVNFSIKGDEDGKIKVTLNAKLINKNLKAAGFNLIVTSELDMKDQDIYDTYHNLWRIEESFRVMKSELDARPIYLQKEETITGHFLVCYLAVLLVRILQFKILDNKYSSQEIFNFIRDYRVVYISERKYLNITKISNFIQELSTITDLPIKNYFLNNTDIHQLLNHRFTYKKNIK